MTIDLRSEKPGDEEAVDIVNCSAFEEMAVANIVRLMRAHHPAFDPRYSITAWDGDRMVGHALFVPATIPLMGERVRALGVGPVGVIPQRQRTGIGLELLRFGHELGRADGFAVAFLYGHPTYYPRVGYKPCFGFPKVAIDTEKLPKPTAKFIRMPVRPDDIPWLMARYRAEWDDVDFSWDRGDALGEWTIPSLNAMVWWTEDGRRAAYTVAPPGKGKCKMLLADDPALAREVLAALRPSKLEHHPSGWLARNAFDPEWATAEARLSDAGMACELLPGVLEPYLQAVQAKKRAPGFAVFPLPFMMDD
jgi:putative acetyltransferase